MVQGFRLGGLLLNVSVARGAGVWPGLSPRLAKLCSVADAFLLNFWST